MYNFLEARKWERGQGNNLHFSLLLTKKIQIVASKIRSACSEGRARRNQYGFVAKAVMANPMDIQVLY